MKARLPAKELHVEPLRVEKGQIIVRGNPSYEAEGGAAEIRLRQLRSGGYSVDITLPDGYTCYAPKDSEQGARALYSQVVAALRGNGKIDIYPFIGKIEVSK